MHPLDRQTNRQTELKVNAIYGNDVADFRYF